MSSFKTLAERFYKALSLAIYDRELQARGENITYYYDTDVIFPLIMGFEADTLNFSKERDQLLVRSLLSCGYLGEFCMLRPHALELTEMLRRQQWSTEGYSKAVLQQKIREFLNKKGIWKIMSKLKAIAEGEKDFEFVKDETRIQDFINKLRDNAGETFAYIEMVNGTWRQRLKRYYDCSLLNLDKLGPDIYDLLGTYKEEVREINRILLLKRKSRTKNVFQDALGLTILYKEINNKDKGETDHIVRFYTETLPIIEDLEENKELQNLLSYQKPFYNDLETPHGAEFIFRDAGYFVIRAWFSDLSPDNQIIDDETINNLKQLSSRLRKVLTLDEERLEEAIRDIRLNEQELIDLIKNFENLTIMDSIWVGDRIPKALKNLNALKEWTKVFKFAERPETEEILSEKIQDVRKELESKVSMIQRWKNDSDIIMDGREKRLHFVKGKIEDIMRDLGLVRWGYSLTTEERELLVKSLKDIFQSDIDDFILVAGTVAILMNEARNDPRKCMVICGILWALKQFKHIVKIVNECKDNNESEHLPPSLLVIQAAAEARSGGLNKLQKREIVDKVWNFLETLPENQRVGILLGVGYVLYHVWKQENVVRDTIEHESSEVAKEIEGWAEKCFYLGEEAARKIPKENLAWAFAINHCAYVGIVTKIEPDKTEKYFQLLLRLENNTAFWNFRFDDTIGTTYLIKAERLWGNSSSEKKKEIIPFILSLLDKADEHFEKASLRDTGDIDLDEHRNRSTSLRASVEVQKLGMI